MMNSKASKRFYAAQEILTTEQSFYEILYLLDDQFRTYIKKRNVVPASDFEKIFSNLGTLRLFSQEIRNGLEQRINEWNEENSKIGDVLVRIGPFMRLFYVYTNKLTQNLNNFEKLQADHPKFKEAVLNFEHFPNCKKMKIYDHFMAPYQRLPRYQLLLATYHKELKPNSVDYEDACKALEIVTEAVGHVNSLMKKSEHFHRILKLSFSCGSDIIKPQRIVIKEGPIKKVNLGKDWMGAVAISCDPM